MDYTHIRKLRNLLYVLYKLDLSDEVHAASIANAILKRTFRVMERERNEAAKNRILEKYGHINPNER